MKFQFATATRIVFGNGAVRETGNFARGMGRHAFVVTGSRPESAAVLLNALDEKKITARLFPVKGEPTTETVKLALEKARELPCDLFIGFGGGSAIDTAKAVAALIANGGEPLDYLEVIGRGKAITKPPAPFIAIPTTSGTGAEVTHNAVMESPEHKVKVSLRSPLMFAGLAIVDPELTWGTPPEVTASAGLDALTQVIEPFLSNQANPMTDALCREGISRAARALKTAYQNGSDRQAREDMALTSLFGGIALANAKLGAVHGFAGPLGGMFRGGHGALCASLLPHVMEVNLRALGQRAQGSEVLLRYGEVAALLTGRSDATAPEGVTFLKELCAELHIPSLSAYGVKKEDIGAIVEKASASSSMKGNPVALTGEELREIVAMAL